MFRNSARGAVVRNFWRTVTSAEIRSSGSRVAYRDIPNLCVAWQQEVRLCTRTGQRALRLGDAGEIIRGNKCRRYRGVVAPVKTLVPELPVFDGEPSLNTVAPFQPVEAINVVPQLVEFILRPQEHLRVTRRQKWQSLSKKLIGRNNNLHCLN